MLKNHRRTFWHAAALLGAMLFVFFAVGRHHGSDPTATTLPFVGRWDLAVYRFTGDIRTEPLTLLARGLNVLGGGLVTIPLRLVVAAWLGFQKRWRALAVWLSTWAVAEILLASAKVFFSRGRPPSPLVTVEGLSFPSGHAVAGAATAVALVLVLMPAGPERRRWEWAAAAFAFVMASSRVYLHAHWFSDVLAGVLLGSGVALACAAVCTETRDAIVHRRDTAGGTLAPDAVERGVSPP